jgi:ADP-ribose pyrophosphatase YjhB (NUDIX family)/rhodanese-related sulfurtransferase
MLAAARARINPRLAPAEAEAAVRAGALLVDIRPTEQRRRDGEVPGAVVVERNALEWRLDPDSHWRHPALTSADRAVVLLCNEGYQSSLAAALALDLGCRSVTDVDGGFQAWRAAGLPVDGSAPDVVALAEELAGLARTGLSFATDPFDRERYERLLDLATRAYADVGPLDQPALLARFAAETGCITPKVGADAAIVAPDGRLLLVERADDLTWGLVSGWVEPDEHPADTVVREAREEVGLDIAVEGLVGVFARPAGTTTGPHSVVSVVYRATALGGEVRTQPHEVRSARWWSVDDVPLWHQHHERLARAALAP